jgi:hypothetical protein
VFDLWDVETGNMIGTFEREEDALSVVRDLLSLNGEAYADALDLGWVETDGHSRTVAAGQDLARRALARRPGVAPLPSG